MAAAWPSDVLTTRETGVTSIDTIVMSSGILVESSNRSFVDGRRQPLHPHESRNQIACRPMVDPEPSSTVTVVSLCRAAMWSDTLED